MQRNKETAAEIMRQKQAAGMRPLVHRFARVYLLSKNNLANTHGSNS